jgi:hypothetical protein
MDVSDPATNMLIITFLGGIIGNIILTLVKWWQTKGQYDANGIVIKFDNKTIITAVVTLVPIVVLTASGFSSLVNVVNASNPVSYAGAFITALVSTLGANWLLNSQITFNPKQKTELNLKIIEEHAKLHEFNQSLKKNQSEEVKTE